MVGKVLDKEPDGIQYLERFSISYIGFDKNLDTPVTIVEYYPDFLARRDCSASLSVSYIYETAFRHQKQFFQEARKLAKLHTIPGVTHIHNIFQENNTTYIILEHFAGITLEDYMRIQKRTLTLSEVFHVMIPIIKTVEQMHSNGILHQNIVPSRILIQPNGVPKLLDFVEESVITSYIVGTRFETIDDMPVPSYDFMPPEQYKLDEPSGTWSDVYLICATIYYCLTGKIPQYSRSRIIEVDTVDWKQIPGLNRHQIAALEKGMTVDYKKRTDSLEELELELFRFD